MAESEAETPGTPGEFESKYFEFHGVRLPPFCRGKMEDIADFPVRPSDVWIVTYPKSGKSGTLHRARRPRGCVTLGRSLNLSVPESCPAPPVVPAAGAAGAPPAWALWGMGPASAAPVSLFMSCLCHQEGPGHSGPQQPRKAELLGRGSERGGGLSKVTQLGWDRSHPATQAWCRGSQVVPFPGSMAQQTFPFAVSGERPCDRRPTGSG